MSIKSLKDGYMVDMRPQGREGRRIRKNSQPNPKPNSMSAGSYRRSTARAGWIEHPTNARSPNSLSCGGASKAKQ